MAKEKAKVTEEVSPNLIPMIDIMFLLLLFFMLSADMSQRELEEVRLPRALSIKEDKKDSQEGASRLMINVYHRYSTEVRCETYNQAMKMDDVSRRPVCREENHWRVGIKGRDYSKVEDLEKRLDLEAKGERKDPNSPISERKVMIRVDELAPYGLAQRAMNSCAKVGIYKIEVGAARPPDADKGGKKTKR